MRCTLLLALTMFFAVSANAQNDVQNSALKDSKTPKEDQCSVAGMVVTMAGSAPLKKARLSLSSTSDVKPKVSAVTTADGHFTLKAVDPGTYRLTVERTGYVRQEYGQRKPEARGAVLTLQARQQMKDLLFRMIPAGVISGKILDEDGEPLPGVVVEALQQSYTEGKRHRQRTHTAESNDLGEYRLFGLWPGRYYVRSTFQRWNTVEDAEDETKPGEEEVGYAKMYYPGTPDAVKASFLTIKPGDELPSVDILMRKVSVHTVRGHVYNQVTHKPEAQTQVLLVARDKSQFDFVGNAEVKGDGSFAIRDVLPGAYALIAFWNDEDTNYMNRQTLDVGEADLEGVSIAVVPGVNIAGRIVWDGQPSVEKEDLSLNVRPVDLPFAFRGQTRVMRDYTFTMKQVGEGTYRLNVNGLSKDCYIKELRYGTSTSEKGEFTVVRGESRALEVTVSSKGARAQGTVLDADGLPQSGVSVVLIPHPSHRETFSLYHVESTDQYGHFDVRGIAPGDYKLFSWEEVEEDAWQDPEFLRPFETKGESVHLEDGDQKTVKITAIKTKEPATDKP